jgi:hypothetical protein
MRNSLVMLRPLCEAHSIDINGVLYLHYEQWAHAAGCSTHINQARKRQEAYPQQFIRVNGKLYMALRYAIALMERQLAEQQLINLKEGGTL